MRIVLLIVGILVLFFGFAIMSGAKSAIHEIEAFILFLISVVLITSSEIIASINKLTEKNQPIIDKNIDTVL